MKNLTFKEFLLNELTPIAVGRAMAPDQDTIQALARQPEIKRARARAAQQQQQAKSSDPLDRQIAAAREKLARLMQLKKTKDEKKAQVGQTATVQPVGGA